MTFVFRLPSVASSIEARLTVGGSTTDTGNLPACRLGPSLCIRLGGGTRKGLHCGVNSSSIAFLAFAGSGSQYTLFNSATFDPQVVEGTPDTSGDGYPVDAISNT